MIEQDIAALWDVAGQFGMLIHLNMAEMNEDWVEWDRLYSDIRAEINYSSSKFVPAHRTTIEQLDKANARVMAKRKELTL